MNKIKETYLMTQDGKFLRTYNEWGNIETTDDINDAHEFSEQDAENDLYYDSEGWSYNDEPLMPLDYEQLEFMAIVKGQSTEAPTSDGVVKELLAKYFDNYLGRVWPTTDIRFVTIFYKGKKFYVTDDYVNTEEVTVEWVKMTCELFFMKEER